MKSLRLRNVAGNTKLNGKKTCRLSCGCCEITNFKDQEREKEMKKEIEQELSAKEMAIQYLEARDV
jgi:hypothetical protein